MAAIVPSYAAAQAVPIPFAATYAGGGPVCSSSLSVFAVSGTGAKYGDGCPATQAVFNTPVAVATDNYGNVFVADQTYQLVRVIYNGGSALATALATSNVQNPGLVPQKGSIYTIAGGITATPTEGTKYCNQAGSGVIGTGSQLDNCPASESEQGPRGLAVDADGNLFISSVSPNSQVRVLYVAGTAAARLITLQNPTITSPIPGYVYNLAGANASSYTGDGASAVKATLNTPRGLFVDANENVYFADQLNLAIRRIDSTTGNISTVAGHNAGSVSGCSAVTSAGDGGSATSASLACPYGVTLDSNGNIFIAEAGNGGSLSGRVRVVYEGGTLPGLPTPAVQGAIYTYAGASTGTTGALAATFQEVFGVTLDHAGYLYVTDYRTGSTGSNRIWRIDPTNGNIASIAGNGASTLTSGSHCNGGLTGPTASNTYGDGCPGTQAYLNIPAQALGFAANGTFYVTDRGDNLIRSFSYNNIFPATATGSSVTQPLAFLYPAGIPATEAFNLQGAASADYTDGGGDTCVLNTALTSATTCVDYVKFSPTAAGQRPGSITVSSATATVAFQALSGVGTAPVLTIDPGTAVTLGDTTTQGSTSTITPLNISTDRLGNVNISDGKGKQVLRTTIAGGNPTVAISGLGTPRETTTDPYGNLYVVDSANNNVAELKSGGGMATLGSGLSAPQGIVADLFGNLYIADTGNNRVIYLSPVTGSQSVVSTTGFTLSAPTYLGLDSSGNLYIVDTNGTRLLELPLGGMAQQIALPAGAAPAAFALDAAGDLYLADTTTKAVLFQATGTSTAKTLVSGLTTPAGVAVGASGNLFVADSGATAATGYNRSLNTTVFASTNVQLTSLPAALTLSDVGNQSLTLATPSFMETGSTSAFPPTGTATCTAGLVEAPGTTCTQSFQFAPTTPGQQSAKVVFSSSGSQSVTANLSGFATNLILTQTTVTLTNTGPVNYGQTANYSVTLTPASMGSAAPGGSIAFDVDGSQVSSQSVGTGPYTFTVSLAVGTHSIAAIYSGDAIYAGSNASTMITVGKAITSTTASYTQVAAGTQLTAVVTPTSIGAATFTNNVVFYVDSVAVATLPVGNGKVSTTVLVADGTHSYYASYAGDANYAGSSSTTQPLIVARASTSLALTITPVSNGGVAGLQLSAKLTATGTPSGTITFSNNGSTLGIVNLSSAVNGVVTFVTPTVTYTNYTFTAAYSGDGLFEPSSASATEGADFVLVAPTTALGVPEGAQAVENLTVTAFNGYTGALTASCTNLPANSLCRFAPATVAVTAPASSTLQLEFFAGVNPNVGSLALPPSGRIPTTLLALLLFAPLTYGLRRRRLGALFMVAILAVITTALAGCGSNKTPANSPNVYTTPAGTYAVTVNVTDTNNTVRSAVVNVTVTQ